MMAKLILSIAVLFSPADGPLTQHSAQELTWYLQQLYQTEVVCMADTLDPNAVQSQMVIAIGSAADALAEPVDLKNLERQVLIRRTDKRTEVLLRGGSPLATRAAVFRFLEHCGVLFGPLQDFFPEKKAKPQWEPTLIREKATRPIFGPHYWINFTMDPSSFTRKQWLQMVSGWSRMGVTTMGYHFYQNFPWYDLEMRDYKDQSGYFFYGWRHPMPDEPELNYAVKNDKYFVSPDVESFAEDMPRMHAWAQETIRQSMALAHELGMKNSVTFEPFGHGAYSARMKEWNDGKGVDFYDYNDPLVQEYVLSSLKSVLKTYPDIDILKLVSGESGTSPGTEQELKDKINAMADGDLTDFEGKPVELPTGAPLAILANALRSCKLAYIAVTKAREKGILPDGLQIAIGCYPGSNFNVHPALYALIGKVVPDKDIKIHFLPAHGMGRSADALDLVKKGTFAGRTMEISGWTEFDGQMYFPQSCLAEIEHMNRTLTELPVDALYAIQWRVASTTFDNAYFCRSQWDNSLTPEAFWKELTPLYGKEGVALMQNATQNLEKQKAIPTNLGFCVYGCWLPLSPAERESGTIFATPEAAAEKNAQFTRIAGLFAQAADAAASKDGKRLADYFANKCECGAIHCDYWKLASEANQTAKQAFEEGKSKEEIAQLMIPFGQKMQAKSEDYLKHYQKVMFDRTDEGMLSSYYNTATHYGYRYANPDKDDATSKFYFGPANKKKKAGATSPEQVPVVTPDIIK